VFMAKMYTTEDVLAQIEIEIGKSSLRQVARDKEISPSQLSDTRTGRVPISEAMARAFGFERHETTEVTFRKSKLEPVAQLDRASGS
jgi:hypothetical protein